MTTATIKRNPNRLSISRPHEKRPVQLNDEGELLCPVCGNAALAPHYAELYSVAGHEVGYAPADYFEQPRSAGVDFACSFCLGGGKLSGLSPIKLVIGAYSPAEPNTRHPYLKVGSLHWRIYYSPKVRDFFTKLDTSMGAG